MPTPLSLVDEVEAAMQEASTSKRFATMQRVTDLFTQGAGRFTDDQIALFDGVFARLITHIEERALVELSQRLRSIANAPRDTVSQLARHDNIAVAGPILSDSPRLSDEYLIEIANTKGDAHLAKIAGRSQINEAVTDVLVDRGNCEVTNELAVNPGARFSTMGMSKLVMHADGDDRLSQSMARRTDIPPRMFRQLFAQATEVVRARMLASADPSQKDSIKNILAEISVQVARNTTTAKQRVAAKIYMRPIAQDTRLIQKKIFEYAGKKRLPEVIAGLSLLSAIPFEQIEQLFCASNIFGLMVLCKSLAMDWQATYMLIVASPTSADIRPHQVEEIKIQYDSLQISSAKRLIHFWQRRKTISEPELKAL